VDGGTRREMLDGLAELNQERMKIKGDPEIGARISQYEMAFRMQTSVPELTDISKESKEVLDLYGPEVKQPGTFAYNCLLARRLAERGVRFTQVFLRGWDHHGGLPGSMRQMAPTADVAAAGLIKDLKQKGMLDDTIVVWGGEFGRTVYSQGTLTKENYGRDHHPRNFTMLVAGGGFKRGYVHGETDDFSYNILDEEKKVHIHDLNATLLHCMGIDHEKMTYKFQGRDFRLTDVQGKVVKDLLA
jgi:arylsulfatase A-like enzyme